MIPIFTKRVAANFENSLLRATKNFESNIESYTLINKNHSSIPWKNRIEDENQPPESLLEFYPLAEYLNNVLTAFNELRLCAPLAVVRSIVESLQDSLVKVAKAIVGFYGQEQQAFTSTSKDAFTRLCICFADDLVPFLQKSVHVIFPLNVIAAHIGISVQNLQKERISFLDKDAVVAPIKHLLPVKIEPIFEKNETSENEQKETESAGANINDGQLSAEEKKEVEVLNVAQP